MAVVSKWLDASRLRGANRHKGFTLLELMIVVAVIALLTAIALPSYRDYVLRSRRTDGKTALTDMRAREEAFYYRCNRYGGLDEITGSAAPTCTATPSTSTSIPSPNRYYTVTLSSVSNTDYTLLATPQNDQAKDKCGNLSLTRAGVKTASTSQTGCW